MRVFTLLSAAMALIAAPLAAQVALPRVPLPQVGPILGEVLAVGGEGTESRCGFWL